MDKAARPVRHRRHSRRAWPPGDSHHHRLQKRLFTPEIKRMLKDWLVRRRDNPYPSRDEKKSLAIGSGLTYIQICNWFANWRRKLKNAGREPSKRTWGNLIKNYNTSANGNVEQFSISSNDSIWGDEADARNAAAAAAAQQHQMFPHQQQMMCLAPTQTQFHPDYRPNHYDDNGGGGGGGAGDSGSRTIEYYDRYGELVIRTTAASVADAHVLLGQQHHQQQQQQQQHPQSHPQQQQPYVAASNATAGGYFYGYFSNAEEAVHLNLAQEQCFQISSTTPIVRSGDISNNPINTGTKISQRSSPASNTDNKPAHKPPSANGSTFSATTTATTTTTPKYKSNIMEKYLRDLQPTMDAKDDAVGDEKSAGGEGRELSKWLESAANFTPDKKNYIEWEGGVRSKEHKAHQRTMSESSSVNHEREELEAAEALTSLAGNYRSRMFGMGIARP